MQSLTKKRLIAAIAAITGLNAGLALAGGLLSPLQAQCGGGGGGGGPYCERNLCSLSTGKCFPSDPNYNCHITLDGGCADQPC